jgi:dihydrofolate reductase
MRKLIYAINLTADGCCDHTKGSPGVEMYEYHGNLLRDAGTLLYGRITYQLMIPYWPDVAKSNSAKTKAESDFVKAFEAISDIVVFSKSLSKGEDERTRIVSTDLQEEILRIKQGEGKSILVGGVDLPSQLVQLGLVDEIHVIVQPTIAGAGRRLFNNLNLPESLQLKLVESKVFESGSVALRYIKS